MDLGIAGRKAIVCASSKGLGLACATELARNGADVVINGRDDDRLQQAAGSIAAAVRSPSPGIVRRSGPRGPSGRQP